MKKRNKLCRVFTGTEINVLYLKRELEENGISAFVQNDYKSGLSAGFIGGTLSTVDLYIKESDLKKAEPIIKDFFQKDID